MKPAPIVRDLCLVGGGHSHVLLIRRWAMQPLPGVRLTLVSTDSQTPYSGMLPGLIAGHYDLEQIHIDLRNLCAWAGVRFVEERMRALDLTSRHVLFEHHPALQFDVVSLDTGSTPDLSVPGASSYTTPVKPVHDFYSRWKHISTRAQSTNDAVSIGVVGSGAGGFELVMAMRHALPAHSSVYWFVRGAAPLKGQSARVGRLALAAARRLGIAVVTEADIQSIDATGLYSSDGRVFQLDEVVWCTGAVGPQWAKEAGLAIDARGFVATNAHLQSTSHSFVFATGDVGTQVQTPSAKAGVFAVRQAPILFENLRRYLLGDTLKPYRPQKQFLSLMALGDKRGIASRGSLALEADWVWRWKDHIDTSFMRKFRELPLLMANPALNRLPDALRTAARIDNQVSAMRCKGCGAKVGGDVLDRIVRQLDVVQRDDVVHGLSAAADSATLRVADGVMVQSVDQIDGIVDDAYVLGRIAALHALSDVVTVDATPQSAQVMVTLPSASETIVERDLHWLMTGLVSALNEEGCALVGGHTTQGDELSVGVVVNALLNTDQSNVPEAKMLPDNHQLILTQSLGIGTVFAGLMQQKGDGVAIAQALADMQRSNQPASVILHQHGAVAMTDVTGFGLLGHLSRLIDGLAPMTGAMVELEKVPMIPAAVRLADDGVRSTLWPANSKVLSGVNIQPDLDGARLAILCDPQTGGGLLAIVPRDQAEACVTALGSAGYSHSAVIGSINTSGIVSLTQKPENPL